MQSGVLGGSEWVRAENLGSATAHWVPPLAALSASKPNKVIEIDAVAKEVGRRAGLLRK